MKPLTINVYLRWEDLFDRVPTLGEVLEVVRTLNRQSTLMLLARIEGMLFLDWTRRKPEESIKLGGFLVSNLCDDEVLNRAKQRFGSDRVDFRPVFHTQQILMMMKWVIAEARADGGNDPGETSERRFELGRALIKTSSLLTSASARDSIASARKKPSEKGCLGLQLSVGSGNQLNNPPPLINGAIRSTVMYEQILKEQSFPIDLSAALKRETGLPLDAYIDLTLGVLSHFIGRQPAELVDGGNVSIINARTFFGDAVPREITDKYWELESSNVEDLARSMATTTSLEAYQDFTALRIKPFLRLEGDFVTCLAPSFVQEKLEIGLFWTIVNSLKGDERQKAFETWGRLFERYVNLTIKEAVDPSIEQFHPCPDFAGKKYNHESFDGLLLSGKTCVVFECKGGFLPAPAKYSDNLEEYIAQLDKKFGSKDGAGIEQLARKIGQVFAKNKSIRRAVKDIDLSSVSIVVPVMVVQEDYASSLLAIPWLAKTFRDLMRRSTDLNNGVVWPSLLILHVEDVEKLAAYVKNRSFSMTQCLLDASKKGDPGRGRLFSFDTLLRTYVEARQVPPILRGGLDEQFLEILDRLSRRIFGRTFRPGEGKPQAGTAG